MRSLINNEILNLMLEIIENTLGYPVKTALMDQHLSRLYKVGVRRDTGKWKFFVPQGAKFSENDICHELLHIVQCIEGYPEPSFIPAIRKVSPEADILRQVFNNLQHTVLWPRVIRLGFNNEEEKELKTFLKAGTLANCCLDWPQPYKAVFIANMLQAAYLIPMDETIRTLIMRQAVKEQPQAFTLAQKINNELERYFPLTPESYIQAIRKNLFLLGINENVLLHEFPEKTCPDLFEKIEASL